MIECILFVPDQDNSKSKRWGREGNGPQSEQWGRVVLIHLFTSGITLPISYFSHLTHFLFLRNIVKAWLKTILF